MAQPQYIYDPITQTFKLVDPTAPAQPVNQGLGSLYNTDGGGDVAMGTPGGPNLGTLSPMATEIGVGLQNIGQFTATNPVMAAFSPVTSALTSIAGSIGNSIMGTEVSPVANPTAPQETSIAPSQTANLAAMNESVAAEEDAPEGVVSVGPLSMVSPEAIAEAVSVANAQAEAAQAAATAASDSGPATATGSGEASDAGVSGANSEASHSADGNNSGDSGDGGSSDSSGGGTDTGAADSGWYKGGPVTKFAEGGGVGGLIAQLIRKHGLYGGEQGMYDYDSSAQTFTPNFSMDGTAQPQGGFKERMYTYKPEDQTFKQNFASGGVADAYKTQARGRGPDTMLVHMSPKEVQGLQALAMAHGGSLTINPKTGLPEAGFLDAILPMVAGAALAATGVGAPMAALMVGGGTALMTGDLSKGFMAGLGAFGGAGLGAGLAGAGAATAPAVTGTQAGLTAAGQAAVAAPTATLAPGAVSGGSSLLQAAGTTMPASGAATFIPTAAQTSSTAALQAAAGTPAFATAAAPVAAPATFSGNIAQMGQGIQALGTEAGRAGFMQGVGGTSGLLKYGGAAGSALLSGMEEEPEVPGKQQTYIRPYKYSADKQEGQGNFQYRTGTPGESTSELTYFKPNFSPQGVYKYEDYMAQNMAAGGIASMAKGRYLKGAGDGMSDDIPATIEGGQPARLADGEFVVPADVVSHLGNGSSNAGAKKLYKMMDRIRTARTGKKSQAPEVKTDRYMPA
jgi:hypothetical protein